jgi:hypothetical protein
VGRSDRASLYDESLPPGLILGTGQDESMPDKGAERPGRSDAIGPQCAVPLQPELTRFDCPGMHREVSRNDREVDHGEEGDEGKEESRCSEKDDEICSPLRARQPDGRHNHGITHPSTHVWKAADA